MSHPFRMTLIAVGIALAGSASAEVTFFEGAGFSGREFTTDRPVENFEQRQFNDRAHSAIVNSGQWEVCTDAGFSGTCRVLGPGRYPDLGELSSHVSSVRPTAVATYDRDARRGRHDRDNAAQATLYEGRNLSGRSFTVDQGAMPNLERTGLNDRVSSLHIEAGYWIFCSDANFEGDCLTFGPGDYASLPQGMNNRISSGRRISNAYPYNEKPAWQQR